MTPIDLLVIVAVAAFVAFAFWSNRRHHKDRIDAQKTSKAKRLDACANKLRQDSPAVSYTHLTLPTICSV